MQKVTLVILDGFGINKKNVEENSIVKANSPTFNYLFDNLTTELNASGKAVGIPDGQMGNSEVGHMTIGAGRIIKQSLVKIDDSFDSGEFQNIESFRNGIQNVINNKSNIHLFTLFGTGGVHAHSNHLEKILKIIPKSINVYLHIFTDGRDVEPKSFLGLFKNFNKSVLLNYKNVFVSSISGRYYAMDRDNNWDRVKIAYDEIVYGYNETKLNVEDYINKSYDEGLTDEFIIPASFSSGKRVGNGDSIFFLNYRSDRAVQLAKLFYEEGLYIKTIQKIYEEKGIEKEMSEIDELKNIYFVTMTKYYKEYTGKYFIESEKVDNCLSEVLQNNNLSQLHIAETEKFAHVTKFFNGGKQIIFNGEKDILVPSHKVQTYDLDPEMSAEEIFDSYISNTLNFDFTVINYANGDMVGHTGNMDASIKSVKKLDEIIKKTIDFCEKNNIDLLITADHGNCEEMGSLECPKTSHTVNFVPFWYIKNGKIVKTFATGGLSNITPTVLKIMGIERPNLMDYSLI
nr:2,3-bisphosphoglycerate-independent phosphoglycerate mutase [Candidatus Gracilibacteria bacterium]